MGKIYQVFVQGLRSKTITVDLCNTEEQFRSMTVLQLKEKLAQKLPESTGRTEDNKTMYVCFYVAD